MRKVFKTNARTGQRLKAILREIKSRGAGGSFSTPDRVEFIEDEAGPLDLLLVQRRGQQPGERGSLLLETDGEIPAAKRHGGILYVKSGVPRQLSWAVAVELADTTEDAISLWTELRTAWQ